MSATGRVVTVPERYQDAVTAISGSGPAYLFFVEAMIEAGVHLGLPRDTATELVVQTMLGSAKLLRETGEHPTVLRERVTSPGGTTAAAIRQLEDHKVRAASSRRWNPPATAAATSPRQPAKTARTGARERSAGPFGRPDSIRLRQRTPDGPGRVSNTISLARQLGVLDRSTSCRRRRSTSTPCAACTPPITSTQSAAASRTLRTVLARRTIRPSRACTRLPVGSPWRPRGCPRSLER